MFWRVPSNGNHFKLECSKGSKDAKQTRSRELLHSHAYKGLLGKVQGCFLGKTNYKYCPNWKHHPIPWQYFAFSQAWKWKGWEWDSQGHRDASQPCGRGGPGESEGAGQKKEQHCWISALPPDCSQCVLSLYTACIWLDASINFGFQKEIRTNFDIAI